MRWKVDIYDNPKMRKSWVHPDELSTNITKPNIHTKKVLLCIRVGSEGNDPLWYINTILWIAPTRSDCWALSTVINSCMTLEEKRPFTGGRRKVILLQDNTRSHTTKNTLKIMSDLSWEIFLHAAYSPDLAPSDYHLFRAL